MRFPSDSDGIKQVVQQAVSFDSDSLTISTKINCECEDGAAAICTDTCGGTAPFTPVSVSKTYSSPLPTATILGITTLSGSAVMRAN